MLRSPKLRQSQICTPIRGQCSGPIDTAADYHEAATRKTKRIGRLTRYGVAWGMYADLMSSFYDLMTDNDTEHVIKALEEHRELLGKQRQAFDRIERSPQDFREL